MADRALPDIMTEVLHRVSSVPGGPEELGRFNHVFQFLVTDGEPFVVAIRSGTVTVSPGQSAPLPFEEMETVRGKTATLRALIEGRARLVDLGWDGQVLIPLYGPKMHMSAWLNRLIKLAHGIPLKLEA